VQLLTSKCISVVELSPYPHVTGCNPRKRKAESSTVLTSTPNKNHLEETQRAKKQKASLVNKHKGHAMDVSQHSANATAGRLQFDTGLQPSTTCEPRGKRSRPKNLKGRVTKTNRTTRKRDDRAHKLPTSLPDYARPPILPVRRKLHPKTIKKPLPESPRPLPPRLPTWLKHKKISGNTQLLSVVILLSY